MQSCWLTFNLSLVHDLLSSVPPQITLSDLKTQWKAALTETIRKDVEDFYTVMRLLPCMFVEGVFDIKPVSTGEGLYLNFHSIFRLMLNILEITLVVVCPSRQKRLGSVWRFSKVATLGGLLLPDMTKV